MSVGAAPNFDFSVNLSDLDVASQLRRLINKDGKPAFHFAELVPPLWDKPIQTVPSGLKLEFNVSEKSNWTTATGIGFGLGTEAKCELQVITSGPVFDYRASAASTDTAGLPAEDYSGSCYVKIGIGFEITGKLSGAGAAGPFGISGNAKASQSASYVFAHKVGKTATLKDAVTEAFNKLVFPFQPSCANDMNPGDLAQVSFHGTLNASFEIDYGIADYNFAAPSVSTALIRKTLKGEKLSLPSVDVSIGASASVSYSHTDDFSVVVQKLDTSDALLYLMRAHKGDTSAGLGLAAQVTIDTASGVKLDEKKLSNSINGFTNGVGGSLIAGQVVDLQKKLNNKLNDWVNRPVQNGVSLQAAWDSQHEATMLFKYKLNLNDITLRDKSWNFFAQGDIRSAVGAGGLALEPGSGVNNQICRSFTLGVTFFNFFNAQEVTKYFESSTVEITASGNLRFMFDVGAEKDTDVKKALQKTRVHFVADALAQSPAKVELHIELSETGNQNEGKHIAGVAGFLASNASSDIQQFVASQPTGTLTLHCVLQPTAYGKLQCSEYKNGHPLADQSRDQSNWLVFHDAVMPLLGIDYTQKVTYAMWQQWNEAATGATIADRRSVGNAFASQASAVWGAVLNVQDSTTRTLLDYFGLASSSFMNLCDDLHQLAEIAAKANIPADWNKLLDSLRRITINDVNIDYAKPAVAAILKLCAPQTVKCEKQDGGNTLTVTLTVA